VEIEVGKLECHESTFLDPFTVNIEGRTSYITAFGSTHRSNNKICRANSFSPDQSVYRKCVSICTLEMNPTLMDPVCMQLQNSQNFNTLNMDQVARYVVKSEKEDVFCYPFTDASNFEFYGEYPYKTGWCETECDPSIDYCMDDTYKWGWCIDGCDNERPSDFNENIHELPVHSFVYENCSNNVDTFSEFCTGFPITRPRQHQVRLDNGMYTLLATDEEVFHPGNIGWNGNSTIIREGARYHGRQHTSDEPDVCFGDAGGSVWKLWRFYDDKDATAPRSQVLATLTGVISRFEENCGAFQENQGEMDHPNLPTQHAVHGRIQTNFAWIYNTAFSEKTCNAIQRSSVALRDDYYNYDTNQDFEDANMFDDEFD